MAEPLVGIIMGSKSDWETMRHAAETLDQLGVPHETKIVSAHRTPKRLYDYAHSARGRGLRVVIAGAGGAAHLPGMTASMTSLPVLGVPIETQALKGMDSLLSIVQMPAGVPVGTLAIGKSGAINAALLAAAILANHDAALAQRLQAWREKQTGSVAEAPQWRSPPEAGSALSVADNSAECSLSPPHSLDIAVTSTTPTSIPVRSTWRQTSLARLSTMSPPFASSPGASTSRPTNLRISRSMRSKSSAIS